MYDIMTLKNFLKNNNAHIINCAGVKVIKFPNDEIAWSILVSNDSQSIYKMLYNEGCFFY